MSKRKNWDSEADEAVSEMHDPSRSVEGSGYRFLEAEIAIDIWKLVEDENLDLGSKYHDAGKCWNLINGMRKIISFQSYRDQLQDRLLRGLLPNRKKGCLCENCLEEMISNPDTR